MIGYSKISETRRYRRKKRGDAREKTREPEEEGKRTREVEKEGVEREKERERTRRWEGCRGPYAREGGG